MARTVAGQDDKLVLLTDRFLYDVRIYWCSPGPSNPNDGAGRALWLSERPSAPLNDDGDARARTCHHLLFRRQGRVRFERKVPNGARQCQVAWITRPRPRSCGRAQARGSARTNAAGGHRAKLLPRDGESRRTVYTTPVDVPACPHDPLLFG